MTLPSEAIMLTGLSILQPDMPLTPYRPSWFNCWEAKCWRQAGKRSGVPHWLFSRFGVTLPDESGEALRKADYREWVNGLSQACQQALKQSGQRQLFKARKERCALFYFESWGETTHFEQVNSWRDSISINMLPKNVVRDYGITGFTFKTRGERSGFFSALLAAQDYLNSGQAECVVLCGLYRNFPVLAFSEPDTFSVPALRQLQTRNSHCSVERLACLILRKKADRGISLQLSAFHQLDCTQRKTTRAAHELAQLWQAHEATENTRLYTAMPPSCWLQAVTRQAAQQLPGPSSVLSVTDLYGDSGCLNPVLALQHWQHTAGTTPRALITGLDGHGDVWLLNAWQTTP